MSAMSLTTVASKNVTGLLPGFRYNLQPQFKPMEAERMKKLFVPGLFLLMLMPVLAMAQSPFDGTWKIDMNSLQFPKKPEVYLLQNGMYECKTCVPPINIKADGQDQKVTGQPYYDTMSIKPTFPI
jgi:hypothetical protein